MGSTGVTEVIADLSAFPHRAAAAADNLSRKAVSVLILPAVSVDAFLGSVAVQNGIGGIVILVADDSGRPSDTVNSRNPFISGIFRTFLLVS